MEAPMQQPVLEYSSAVHAEPPAPPWNVVVARTLAGLFGVPVLLMGAGFTVAAIFSIPQMISYYYHHSNDVYRLTDTFVGIALVLLAILCDCISVRWINYALRGKTRRVARKWRTSRD
jgi:hypothetical protein